MDEQLHDAGTNEQGKRIADAESALFERFLSKLDEGRYDECHKITGLMERLSLI